MAPRRQGVRQNVQAARYVSQFDPGAQDLTQRILRERSNRFEQSFAGLQAEQAKQGEIFFLDEQAKQNTLGRFNTEKEDILKKYNNDYEAAAPELSKLIVKERNNPIYNLNTYQQGKVKEYQQQVNRIGAENVIEITRPDTSLTDEQGNVKDPSAFDYEILDRSKIQAKGAQWASQIKPTERPLELTKDGKFYEQISEITQEDFMNNLTDEKIAKFLETTPELARLAEVNNHEPIEFTRQYLISQNQGIVGIHKRGYLQNKDYLSAKDRAALAPTYVPLTPIGATLQPTSRAHIEDLDEFYGTDIITGNLAASNKTRILEEVNKDPVLIGEANSLVEEINKTGLTINIEDLINKKADPITGKKSINDAQGSINLRIIQLKQNLASIGKLAGYKDVREMSKEEKKAEIKELNKLYKNIESWEENYDQAIENKLGTQGLDQNVEFFAIDNLIGGAKDVSAMNARVSAIQRQLDNISIDRFDFVDAPRDVEFLDKSEPKKQQDDLYKELKKPGGRRLTSLGISDNSEVLFKIQDDEGREYTIRPRDFETSQSLIRGFEPNDLGPFSFANMRNHEIISFNDQIKQLRSQDSDLLNTTFREYINETIQARYPNASPEDPVIRNLVDGYINAMRRTGLKLDDTIKEISL